MSGSRRRRWPFALAVSSSVILIALLASIVALHTPMARARLVSWAIGRLRSDYRVDVAVGRVRYNLLSLSVELHDLVAASSAHPDVPFFRAREIAVDLPWATIWNRPGEIAVRSLRLTDPDLSIRRFPDGTLNLPGPRPTGPSAVPVFRFDTLTIDRLSVSYLDEPHDLRVETRGVSVSLVQGRSRQIEGALVADQGPSLTFGQRAIRSSRFKGMLGFDGRAIEVRELEIVTPQAGVTVNGRIDRLFAAPTIDARLTGRVNVDAAATLAFPDPSTANDLHGVLDLTGRLTGELIGPVANLDVRGRDVRWRDVAAGDFEARGRLTTREAAIERIQARIGGGSIEASGSWSFETGRSRTLHATWRHLDDLLLRRLIPALPYRLAASLEGDLDLATERAELAAVKATIRNRASLAMDRPGLPIDGSLVLQLDHRAWRLQQAHRIAGGGEITSELHGRLADRFLSSTVDGTAHALVSRPDLVASALGRAGLVIPDIINQVRGDVEGAWQITGSLEQPRASGTVHSPNLQVGEVGSIDASATFSTGLQRATIDRLAVRLGKNSAILSGTIDFRDGAIRGPLEASLDEPALIARLAGAPRAWEPAGQVSLKGHVTGTLNAPAGAADIDGRLAVGGQDLDRVSGRVEIDNIDRGHARVALGLPLFGATADGIVSLTRPYDFNARASTARLDLAALPIEWLRAHHVAGFVDLRGGASGALDRPAEISGSADVAPMDLAVDGASVRLVDPAHLELSNDRITLSRIGLVSGTSELTARLDEGTLHIERAHGVWRDAVVSASGEVPAGTFAGYLPEFIRVRLTASAKASAVKKPDATTDTTRPKPSATSALDEVAHVDVRVENITAGILAGIVPDEARKAIAGSAVLTARLETDAIDLKRVKGAMAIETGPWTIQDVQFGPIRPPRLSIAGGRLLVDSFEWRMTERPENSIAITGGADLEPLRLDARVSGQTDLRLMGALMPLVSTFGDAVLDVRVTGPPTSPRVDGHVRVANAGLTLSDPALAVTDLTGSFQLSETQATTTDLEGRANGGTITGRGTLDYGIFRPTAFAEAPAVKKPEATKSAAEARKTESEAMVAAASLTIAGRGMGLDFPAGLQSEVDADLTLRVQDGRPHLSGRVTVLRGEYRRPLSLVTQLLGGARLRDTQPPGPPSLADRLGLDVRIVTDADIQVDNNYGRVDLGSDLRLLGSLGRPGLVGRAEMREGGQLFLGGTSYSIDRGSIDFGNPTEIVPALDVSARTRVAGHEITLAVSGTPDRLTTDLSADDPSLGKADIVSLLLTGRPYADVTSQQAAASGQQLLGLLSGEVLGVAGRAVGLDTLRFERGITSDLGDLGDVAGERDPTARLTLAKNLSPEVRLLLSHNLKRSGGLTWIVSYQPGPNLDLRLVSRENRDRAYEVRHQVSLGGSTVATPAPSRAPQPRVQAVRFSGETGFGETELLAHLELVEGRRFDFRKWRDDRDRLTRLYGDAGYLEARILPRRVAGSANEVVLEYEIQRGPSTHLDIINSIDNRGTQLSRRAVEAIRSAWVHAVFDRFLEEEAARLARIDVVREGYLQAQVRATIDRPNARTKRLIVSIEPGVRRPDRRITFQGNQVFSTRDLRTHVAAAGVELAAWLNPAVLKQSLTDLYRSSGFLGARVQAGPSQFPTPSSAVLPVTIDEGPKYLIGHVRLNGVSPARQDEVRRTLNLKAGDAYTPSGIDQARDRVERFFRRLGFNDVAVQPSAAVESANARVDVTLDVNEGRAQRLQRVEIEGLEHTRRDIAEQTLKLRPGKPVDIAEWQRGRKRLNDTGVFRRVEIEPVADLPPEGGSHDAQLPIVARVTVEERPPWRIRYGVQIDDEAKPASEARELSAGLVAELLDRNLFGRAATAGSTFRYDRHQRFARAFISTPRLFGREATTSLFLTRSREQRGTSVPILIDKSSMSAEQRLHPIGHLDVTYGYGVEQNHTFNPAADPDDPLGLDFTVRIARLTGTALVDTRDDPFDTRHGVFHSSSLEYAPRVLGSDLRFVKYLAQQTFFRTTRRVVFASSARVGLGHGFEQDLVPSEQFLAGGANSVRGYEDDAIGGRDVLDQPIGGSAMIVLNQEVRFPVYKWVGAVGFVDAGNVFGSARQLDLFNLKVGAGVGLRMTTPFALVRVDFGVPLSEPALGTRRGRWYFSIGQMF